MTTEQNQTPTRLVGKKAPEWQTDALVGTEFKTLSSQDFKGKWKVLFFYPLDFTFVCPTEIVAFDEAFAKFQELNCDVLGCSVDSKFSHFAWTKIPLDSRWHRGTQNPTPCRRHKKIATDFGVLLEDGMALCEDCLSLMKMILSNIPPSTI